MTRLAFYAPMKAPDNPVPSGDRTMARALIAALEAAGFCTDVASAFCTRDKTGDPARQIALQRDAQREAARLIPLGREKHWKAWITYHNYYKAPDLLGPVVSHALGIPYLQVESTRARKRLTGPWAAFAKAAEAASDAADVLFYLTERDGDALKAYRHGDQQLVPLAPFLPLRHLPGRTPQRQGLIAVGMMREGDKLASYRLIAESLSLVPAKDWTLSIAGDGPARAEVASLMAPFGAQVRFLGALSPETLQDAYQTATVLFWPGVNEAFGMVYLEAQAAGLTVVAQDRPGVRDVLFHGAAYPAPEAGPAALAARLTMLLALPKLTEHLGRDAQNHVARYHLLDNASRQLGSTLNEIIP